MGVRLAQITDGLHCTIMVGEKHVPIDQFGVGPIDSSVYNGDGWISYSRGGGMGIGLAKSYRDQGWMFGSYHTAVCQFVFCDGHVQGLPHGISPDILGLLVNREDGEPIPDY
jgi:prepilin-type processing-associated H-X9-DG protein